jgi:uncharacterized protein YkwD
VTIPEPTRDGWSVPPGAVDTDDLAMRYPNIRSLAPVALALVLIGSLAPATLAAETAAVSGSAIAAAEREALTLTNKRRTAAGLRPLRLDTRIAAIARERAAYMARTGKLSHAHSSGKDVFDLIVAKGITWYGAGEIIAWNTAGALDYSAAFAVQGWMKSPSHKAILMSKSYNYVGFGLAIGNDGKRYWAGVYLKGPDRTGAFANLKSAASRSVSSTTTKVYFAWAGADVALQVLTSGFRTFETARRIDGGSWASYGTTTSTFAVRYWPKGHTWDFRVRARDRAGNWGTWKVTSIKT